MTNEVPVERLLQLIHDKASEDLIRCGALRQAQVWDGRTPDYLPLLTRDSMSERAGLPRYDMREQFHDSRKMLYEQLWAALEVIHAKSDAVPSVRVNFGVGFLASVFGLDQEIFADKMPWLRRHLCEEEIVRLTVDDLQPLPGKGLLPRFRDYLETYQESLAETPVRVYLPDTQGPFDLAHLVMGDQILSRFHRNRKVVLHLLSLTSYLYREASLLLKSWIGERPNEGYHAGDLYMGNCGVRCCEDSTTLLSTPLAKLTIPYLRDAVSPFACWIHFCGDGRHILNHFLSLEEVKGINFGNPESYDWDEIARRIVAAGKVYYGAVYRKDGEPLADYFRRVLCPLGARRSLILQISLRQGESTREALRLWHEIQDELF